ncbi:aldehyde dehydrogenase family protein [Acetobacter sp. LMG 1627]|uniref:Aldehyde dehydrogenase family protein n=2 Tax=Acetobacter conturbans TaxID=1737472 RepID=A0ABX0K1L5_9PROT|nr:aldehyde dehydrogenase family protein [Acetobacter conturbans]
MKDKVSLLRQASPKWQMVPMRERLRMVRRFRSRLRCQMLSLPGLFPNRPVPETLTAEWLPLLAASTFLLRKARKILAPRRCGVFGRPLWLPGVTSVVERRPFGAVLILAPGNYPLMLPGIQALQALVAGNAVALKPASGGEAAAHLLQTLLRQAGCPDGLFIVLSVDDGPDAVAAGFDLIILTGSAQTGRTVLRQAAATLTPTIMELSGVDAVFVLPDADLSLVVQSLAYGARLNNGATCIAPHRVFIHHTQRATLLTGLRTALAKKKPLALAPRTQESISDLKAIITIAGGTAETIGNVTLFSETETLQHLLDVDIFAPWLAVTGVESMEEALTLNQTSSYALGASIFGPEEDARLLARRLPVGSICINDLIIPTADPRLPFAGAHSSGYGTTRGPEGLLAVTRPVVTSSRRLFL